MSTLFINGHVDEHHRLSADVPDSIRPGPVTIAIVAAPQEDETGDAWMAGVAREWADELSDPRQDLYTLADGEPVSDP